MMSHNDPLCTNKIPSQGTSKSCIICSHPLREVYKDIYDNRHGYPGLFSLYRCDSCGIWRTYPPLNRGELAHIYSDYYPRSSETARQVYSTFEQLKGSSAFHNWIHGTKISCYHHITPGSRVLDIGCGNCLSLLMARHYGATSVMGIEVDATIIPIAEQLNLDVHIGQLSDLPAEKGTFDHILLNQVLEHEPDPRSLLLEIKKRLKDNGRVILSFPNAGAFYRYIFGKKWLHWHPPYHVNHFSRESIILLAEQCGFKITHMKTITPDDWMTYQLRTLRVHPEPGQRDTFWDPGIPDHLPQASHWGVLLRKLKNAVFSHGVRPIISLVNRLIDATGFGESFVVILKLQ